MPNGVVGEGSNGHVEEYGENAPPAKSPLLTAHRISVTSDMDDASLEEGPYYDPLSLKMRRLARVCHSEAELDYILCNTIFTSGISA